MDLKGNKPIENGSVNENQGESVEFSNSDYKIDNEVENEIWKRVNPEDLNNLGLDEQEMAAELHAKGASAEQGEGAINTSKKQEKEVVDQTKNLQ